MWNRKEPKTYYDLRNCEKRISIHQGGTSSGKTYSILKVLIALAYAKRDKRAGLISIVRKTLPALKKSVYRDFKNILHSSNIPYKENKAELIIEVFNTTFEMIGLDDPQKARGPRREILYCNEANELTWEDFRQLNMRTKVKTIIDYNPSSEFWAHTELIQREDSGFYKTNYTHNPFIDPYIQKEIERFKGTDENYWKIYGLGELGVIEGLIFTNWGRVKEFPEDCKKVKYGLDFGYSNDPTTLIKTGEKEGCLYCQELIFQKGLTNDDIVEEFKKLNLSQDVDIIADSAEPKSIEEIYRKGYNIKPSVKGADSRRNGINKMLQYSEIRITSDSLNLIKEFKNYKWATDKTGKPLSPNKPIELFDHGIDAIRYSLSIEPKEFGAWMV